MNRRTFLGMSLLPALSAAQRLRAAELHRDAIVINVHDHMWRAADTKDMRKGGVTAKVYKPLADGIYWDEKNRRTLPKGNFDWTKKYLEMADVVEGHPNTMLIRGVADIERAKREGKAGIILGNEGTLPLNGSIKMLDTLYNRGLRELALFWPAGNHTSHVLGPNGRLTHFGQEIIVRANELGIVLDPSHLASSPAFNEILEESKTPIIHTHGAAINPRAWTFSEGDLDDRRIRDIADRGGVIGLHFCTYIKNVKGWNRAPTLDDLMDHVEYLAKIGGIECVGIGADHFPFNPRPLKQPLIETATAWLEDRDWTETFVEGIVTIAGMPLFTQGLVGRGFSDEDIRKILGGNVMRVLRQAWKEQ